MNEFWALVDNTYKVKRVTSYRKTHWWRLYVYFFCFLALVSLGYAISRGAVGPIALTAFIPFLLFPAFVSSIGLIGREWSGQTVSWWLTLPYPRAELLLAKLVGMFIRFLKGVAVSVALLALFALAGALLYPAAWTAGALGAAAVVAARLYLLIIVISPLAITLGMLIAVTRKSRLSPLTPIILVAAIYPFSLLMRYITDCFVKTTVDGTAISLAFPASASSLNPSMIVIGIGCVLILSAIVFGVSSYILAEQTEA